jgi:hypothetical protein
MKSVNGPVILVGAFSTLTKCVRITWWAPSASAIGLVLSNTFDQSSLGMPILSLSMKLNT